MRFADILLTSTVVVATLAAVIIREGNQAELERPDVTLVMADEGPYRLRDASPAGNALRLAIAPLLTPGFNPAGSPALRLYLARRLAKPLLISSGRTFAEIDAQLRLGEVSVAFIGSGPFVIGRREMGLVPLAVPVVAGKSVSRAFLIVPAASKVRSWAELRGKSFAFTDSLSSSGRLVPAYALARLGATPGEFFRRFVYTHSFTESIKAVAEGLVDGASVDSLSFEAALRREPSLLGAVRVVWESGTFGIGPVVAHPRVPAPVRNRLAEALCSMAEDSDGRYVLEGLGFDRFARPAADTYAPLESMARVAGIVP
ncbi:MAG: PhnD/SsuA/transferrin family substrate-binding protein [Candidatus Sericytochromatia bacterium]|nr:PhnD/SsuA/transferrin family substrate-binding protein [Candidatus Tanganyikabacteria bacterium]